MFTIFSWSLFIVFTLQHFIQLKVLLFVGNNSKMQITLINSTEETMQQLHKTRVTMLWLHRVLSHCELDWHILYVIPHEIRSVFFFTNAGLFAGSKLRPKSGYLWDGLTG